MLLKVCGKVLELGKIWEIQQVIVGRVVIGNYFFLDLENLELEFGIKIALVMTKSKSRQDCVNHKFNPSAFFFFLLTGATW